MASDVGKARRWVSDRLAAPGIDVVERCVRVVSELASNAIVHGAGSVTLGLAVGQRCVQVAVADEGPELPEVHEPDVEAERYRGLPLVLVFSDSYVLWELAAGGKVVVTGFDVPFGSAELVGAT
jgi:anti-sigma regulatory factor (Ser/Thr protein kinase)